MDTLSGHFEPKKVVMAAQFQIHQRQQQHVNQCLLTLLALSTLKIAEDAGPL